jgi:hypothetical protein
MMKLKMEIEANKPMVLLTYGLMETICFRYPGVFNDPGYRYLFRKYYD